MFYSGVLFNAPQNPHLQTAFNSLVADFKVPSMYMLEGPMLNSEDDRIAGWKNEMLGKGYVAVAVDGMTNRHIESGA